MVASDDLQEQIPSQALAGAPTVSKTALDYLLTYSWAILIVAAIIAIMYFFIFSGAGTGTTGSNCTFNGGPFCQGIIFSSNSELSNVGFLVANLQSHAIAYPQLGINVTGTPNVTGSCSPSLVLQGGDMICNVTFSGRSYVIGSPVTGKMTLSFIPCPSANLSECQSIPRQTYNGTFTAHVSPSLTTTPTSISIFANSTSPAANGGRDQIIATVELLGVPLPGANVSFSQSGSFAALAPLVTTTDGTGRADTYISSTRTGATVVKAMFAGLTANVLLNFTQPATVIAQIAPDMNGKVCSPQNYGTSVVSMDKQNYPCSQLPISFQFQSGVQHSFACLTPIPSTSGTQYVFSSVSVCGLSLGQSGTFTTGAPGSSCIINCEYSTQYYLTESVNPGAGGSATPGSSWVNSGGSVTIGASPNPSYAFLNWVGTGTSSYSGTSPSTFIILNNPIAEQANFKIATSTSSTSTSTSATSTGTSTSTYTSTTSTGSSSTVTTVLPGANSYTCVYGSTSQYCPAYTSTCAKYSLPSCKVYYVFSWTCSGSASICSTSSSCGSYINSCNSCDVLTSSASPAYSQVTCDWNRPLSSCTPGAKYCIDQYNCIASQGVAKCSTSVIDACGAGNIDAANELTCDNVQPLCSGAPTSGSAGCAPSTSTTTSTTTSLLLSESASPSPTGAGVNEQLSITVGGATAPYYTFNYVVVNSIGYYVYNMLIKNWAQTTSTTSFTIPTANALGAYLTFWASASYTSGSFHGNILQSIPITLSTSTSTSTSSTSSTRTTSTITTSTITTSTVTTVVQTACNNAGGDCTATSDCKNVGSCKYWCDDSYPCGSGQCCCITNC